MPIDTSEQADREFERALKEAIQKYPSLKNEIYQSFVRDTREAIVMEQIAGAADEQD